MHCPKCGTEMLYKQEYCTKCGWSFKARGQLEPLNIPVKPEVTKKPIEIEKPKPIQPKSGGKGVVIGIAVILIIVIIVISTWQMGLLFPQSPKENSDPIARISVSSKETYQMVNIQFDGSTSSDPEKKSLSFKWDFGDGQFSTMEKPVHQYRNIGTYSVKLEVIDEEGAKGTSIESIKILNALEMRAQLIASAPSWGTWYIDIDVTITNYGGEEIELCKYGNNVWTLYTNESRTFVDDGGSITLSPDETETVSLSFETVTEFYPIKVEYEKGIYEQEASVEK